MKPLAAILALVIAGCAAPSEAPFIEVRGWGTMREVLREGDTRGRVPLVAVVEDHTWGVGALEDLEGEITIVDGEVSIAQVVDGEHEQAGMRIPCPRCVGCGTSRPSSRVVCALQAWTPASRPYPCTSRAASSDSPCMCSTGPARSPARTAPLPGAGRVAVRVAAWWACSRKAKRAS